MPIKFPLIRAAALSPVVRWASDKGMPIDDILSEADMEYFSLVDVDWLVPVRNAGQLLAILARLEGPDVCCRVGMEADISELGPIGSIALAKRTPRMALEAIGRGMKHHCTHEVIAVQSTLAGITVGEGWSVRFDPLVHHLIQQYTAALIYRLVSLTGTDKPIFTNISMMPHPEQGLAHLTKWYQVEPCHAQNGHMTIEIPASVADEPFSEAIVGQAAGSVRLDFDQIDASFESSVRAVLKLHLIAGKPSIDRLAMTAGCSHRTLQRGLAQLGLTFSHVLDDVRRRIAEHSLANEFSSRADLARALGYSRQSTLSHALRRWSRQSCGKNKTR